MAGTSKRKRTKSRPRGHRRKAGAGTMKAYGCALTSERETAIIGFLTGGDTRGIAAGKAGISERTFQRWMRKGRDNLDELDRAEDDPLAESVELDAYGRFVLRVVEAESGVRSTVLQGIRNADDWRAGAWYLERVANREFGRASKIEEVARDEHGEERSAVDLLMERLSSIGAREKAFAENTADAGTVD